jgi:hypothetical protein
MKMLISFSFLVVLSGKIHAQTADDTLKNYTTGPVRVIPDYKEQYEYAKRRILRVWPYALHAADMLDQIENDIASIERRRQVNKYCKHAYEDLKHEFKYAFLDMSRSEGVMLMKLVHRETGFTVYEISEKYQGKGDAEMFYLMGKIFDQDLKITYDPLGEDFIAEQVITDIQTGLVPFDDTVITFDKERYKEIQDEEREQKKRNKDWKKSHDKKMKKYKKERKQIEKDKKKQDGK